MQSCLIVTLRLTYWDLPFPTELKKLRKIHVNIVDLLESAMTGATPCRFPTVDHLRSYTFENDKVFPIDDPRAGGVLRGLLRHLRRQPGVGYRPERREVVAQPTWSV